MNKVLRYFLMVAVIAASVLAWWRGSFQSQVTAHVSNESTQIIHELSIEVDTCGEQNIVSTYDMGAGESRRIQYRVCGEGAYKLVAVFSRGGVLRGGGGYVENGYVTTDQITEAGITSTASLY